LDRIEQLLRQATTALSQRQLRESRMRMSHVVDALAKLTESGRVIRSADGYRLNR
jgi:hypothetical protein